jgi:hypothetical protein
MADESQLFGSCGWLFLEKKIKKLIKTGRISLTLLIPIILLYLLMATFSAFAGEPPPVYSISTDKAEYAPGETVIIQGSGYVPGRDYAILVHRIGGSTMVMDSDHNIVGGWHTVEAGPDGRFVYRYRLNGILGLYQVNVYDTHWDLSYWNDGVHEQLAGTTFIDGPPKADIDSCANGGVGVPIGAQCIGGAWVNGNLNATKAHYFEGEFVPFRSALPNLTNGATYSLTLGWDTSQGGKHAFDHLGSYNYSETDADPCTGIGTACEDVDTYPVPQDAIMASDPDWMDSPIAGLFTIYGGTIFSTSRYTLTDSNAGIVTDTVACSTGNCYNHNSETSITLYFTADMTGTVVIAWGGHVASRQGWGPGDTAAAVGGSPFHMRFKDFECSNLDNCSVGTQDSQIAAGAVIFPSTITTIKNAIPEAEQPFEFTITSTVSGTQAFALVDNGTVSNTKSLTFTNPGDFAIHMVEETETLDWAATGIECFNKDTSGLSDWNIQSNTKVDIDLAEGEDVTCVYTNTLQTGTISVYLPLFH